MTRRCFMPWTWCTIHAGGMVQCCCAEPDTDMGDFILDWCEKDNRPNIFNSKGIQEVREGLLTGNLRPMCQNCALVADEFITIEQFEKELKQILGSKYSTDKELCQQYRYQSIGLGLTNKCNLNCIYCTQSVQKGKNDYYKAEFPEKYVDEAIDFLISEQPVLFMPGVMGESTIYSKWKSTMQRLIEKYPSQKLSLVTNLNRKYSDEEIAILARYYELSISMESLDSSIYSFFRENGNVDLVKSNIERILERKLKNGDMNPKMSIHVVLCDKSWKEVETLAKWAFERKINLFLGNYEVRGNSKGYLEQLIKPIASLPEEEKNMVYQMIEHVREMGKRYGCEVTSDVFTTDAFKLHEKKNYNRFIPEEEPVLEAFAEIHPYGTDKCYLDIVYDVDNISHQGIVVSDGDTLNLANLREIKSVEVREIHIYKEGTKSSRYGQTTLLRWRKKYIVKDGRLSIKVEYPNQNIEKVMLEFSNIIK